MEKPKGSIRWRVASVAAQRRAMLPVFGGICGSIRATDNATPCLPALSGDGRGAFGPVVPTPVGRSVLQDFLFPDRQPPLDLLDDPASGVERFAAVRARRGDRSEE